MFQKKIRVRLIALCTFYSLHKRNKVRYKSNHRLYRSRLLLLQLQLPNNSMQRFPYLWWKLDDKCY